MAEDEIVSITDSVDTNLSKLHEIVEDREAGHSAVHGVSPLGFCTTRVSRIGPKLFYHSASHIICVLNLFISLISLILSHLFRHLSAYTVILNFDFIFD